MLALIVGLVSFNALANTTYTDVTEYTNRTASDYCGQSQECKVDFSQKLLYAYKDGEKDGDEIVLVECASSCKVTFEH